MPQLWFNRISMGLQRLFEGLKMIGMTVRHCRLPNSAHRGSWILRGRVRWLSNLGKGGVSASWKGLEQMQADTADLFWSGEVTCGFQKGSSLLQWLLGHLWQGERLLQLPIWLSSTRYLSTELTVASSPQWESRRDPEWQPLSVHRKQPLTEGIHGEMDLLGARALQGAVLKRGCACGVCFFDWAVFVWEVSWECGWWLCNSTCAVPLNTLKLMFDWIRFSSSLQEPMVLIIFMCCTMTCFKENDFSIVARRYFHHTTMHLGSKALPLDPPKYWWLSNGGREATNVSQCYWLIPTSMSQSFNLSRIFNYYDPFFSWPSNPHFCALPLRMAAVF